MKKTEDLAKLMYADLKEKMVGELLYKEMLPMALDPIELALLEWKKKGGKPTVLPYRAGRKSERLVRVGVKH